MIRVTCSNTPSAGCKSRRRLTDAREERAVRPLFSLVAGAGWLHVPPLRGRSGIGAVPLDIDGCIGHIRRRSGAVAQLGERVVRNDEVRGSIPLCSTRTQPTGKTARRAPERRVFRFCAIVIGSVAQGRQYQIVMGSLVEPRGVEPLTS